MLNTIIIMIAMTPTDIGVVNAEAFDTSRLYTMEECIEEVKYLNQASNGGPEYFFCEDYQAASYQKAWY